MVAARGSHHTVVDRQCHEMRICKKAGISLYISQESLSVLGALNLSPEMVTLASIIIGKVGISILLSFYWIMNTNECAKTQVLTLKQNICFLSYFLLFMLVPTSHCFLRQQNLLSGDPCCYKSCPDFLFWNDFRLWRAFPTWTVETFSVKTFSVKSSSRLKITRHTYDFYLSARYLWKVQLCECGYYFK